MLQCYVAVGFISCPGIGLCGSCSRYYCSQTFLKPGLSKVGQCLQVWKYWESSDFGGCRVLKWPVALCFCITQESSKSLCHRPVRKSSDLLFGASYTRRTQDLDMKASVSEPWCRSARLDMNHNDTPSGSRAQVLSRTQVKDEKLGHVFAHVQCEWRCYHWFSRQRLKQDSETALTVFRHRSSQNMKSIW